MNKTISFKRVSGLYKNFKRPGVYRLYRVISNVIGFSKYTYVCENIRTKKFTILCKLGGKKTTSWCVEDFYTYQIKTK